ncbi:peptidyl-prolyl cis-trans isomerase [Arenicella xantha]|uniref:peptidylprolyl isomerase n=1 Tax=Arenicella xantha TaxID=644221 RepID=A0A395JFL1_9GAMM|nr:peptidylprolyl isomerase [Arenicella xantha]RBP48519.1 parvulin-like peptidyl-prolyl cis-trans isomerase protein [Arenicella xantha]
MTMVRVVRITVATLGLLLSACDTPPSDQAVINSTKVQEGTLATVNGESITSAELDAMLERAFSNRNMAKIDQSVRSKALESLISAKAMQQSMLGSLEADKIQDIELRTAAFKQELYVKEYLLVHAQPKPVESRRIQDYYDQNPHEFGGGERRIFEMLSTDQRPDEALRNKLLLELSNIKELGDWLTYAESDPFNLNYQRADLNPGLLDVALDQAVNALEVNQVSEAVFIAGRPHLLRLLSVETLQPRPLSEVRASIRQKLGAEQLRQSIKLASDRAIQQADVKRFPAR